MDITEWDQDSNIKNIHKIKAISESADLFKMEDPMKVLEHFSSNDQAQTWGLIIIDSW